MARAPDLRRCRCNLRLRYLRYLRFPSLSLLRCDTPRAMTLAGKGSGETVRYGQCIGKKPRAGGICQVSKTEREGLPFKLDASQILRMASNWPTAPQWRQLSSAAITAATAANHQYCQKHI